MLIASSSDASRKNSGSGGAGFWARCDARTTLPVSIHRRTIFLKASSLETRYAAVKQQRVTQMLPTTMTNGTTHSMMDSAVSTVMSAVETAAASAVRR